MGILENILASIIFAAMGAAAYRWIYLPLRSRTNALAKVLPFKRGKNESIYVCHGLIPPNNIVQFHTIEEGDLSAITLCDGVLASHYGRERVKTYSAHAVEGQLHTVSNVLAVSGPRWNPVAARYLGALGCPVRFDIAKEVLEVRRKDGSKLELETKYRTGGGIDYCHGLIVVGHLELANHKKQNVALCAGMNNLSTFGCAVYLMGLENKSEFKVAIDAIKAAKRGSRGAAAVLLRIRNAAPASSVGAHVPLDPSRVDVDVVEVIECNAFEDAYVYSH